MNIKPLNSQGQGCLPEVNISPPIHTYHPMTESSLEGKKNSVYIIVALAIELAS